MNDPKVLDLVSKKVVPEFPDDKKQVAIMLIIQIATAIIGLIKQCIDLRHNLKTDEVRTIDMFRRPSLLHRIRLRRLARREIKDEHLNTVVDAVLKAGKNITKEDIETLCDAAQV